jgi:hypothetical protein
MGQYYMFPNLQHAKKQVSFLFKKRHNGKHGSLGGLSKRGKGSFAICCYFFAFEIRPSCD